MGLEGLLAPLPLAIAAGLFLGKQAGILVAILITERIGFALRPPGASGLQLWGVALLCGIGFTMSLFIGLLAFPSSPVLQDAVKIGVLGGSLISALVGVAVLLLARRINLRDEFRTPARS
jgi:NhaA family Na+:H+ antiporter